MAATVFITSFCAGNYRSDGHRDGACARQMAREVAPPPDVMMAAQSTNNHQGHHQVQASLTGSKGASIYSYLQTQSGLNFAPVVHLQHWEQQQQQQQQQWSRQDAGSPPPTPPVRDASSLKGVNYGPGHEKFPSWPMSGAAEVVPRGGSHRSKSWTDHTSYPKETGIPYTRPYMKRPNPLKTVLERCEKIPPETYESCLEEGPPRIYLPWLDCEGKALGDSDYVVPSPPERDVVVSSKPHLTQADLEEYARLYRADMEEPHHHQPSYAQSEGYHSYVSSSDSTMATPFLDRLRRDSEASSETLKWLGSTSDMSVASGSFASRPLIAHSARVQTPQRHNSESVLFPACGSGWQSRVQRNNHHNQLRLFPVNTYEPGSAASPRPTVAERIGELERRQTRYSYLDPDKKHRVSDPTLKAIQKKALLSFYERHHAADSCGRGQTWRSEPQLVQTPLRLASGPPQPPPRPRSTQTSRRASSASDYAAGAWRDKLIGRSDKVLPDAGTLKDGPRHQHSNSCGSLCTDLLGPLIVGPSISLDDWVPERPPKKAHLRSAFPPALPDRMVSPDLPPPSPPTVLEDEVFASDEPLPPPPPEMNSDWSQTNVNNKQEKHVCIYPENVPQTQRHPENVPQTQRHPENEVYHLQNGNTSDVQTSSSVPSLLKSATPPRRSSQSSKKGLSSPKRSPTSPNGRNTNRTFARTLSMKRLDSVPACSEGETSRSPLKYQTQKLMVNGKIATSFPVRENAERFEHRTGSILRPSKARFQRIPAEIQNGASPSRSPPHSTTTLDRSDLGGERPSSLELLSEVEANSDQPAGSLDQLSTSKASYLAYRRDPDRDRDVPNFEGSYKRTVSPSDSHKPADCDRLASTAGDTAKCGSLDASHAVIIVDKDDLALVAGSNAVESLCFDSDNVKPSCVDLEETVLTPLIGIEIQTQCDIVSESAPSPPRSPAFESLTLVQRSEVVLHVNAATSDAASQTEREATDDLPSNQVRHKLQEEIECERLSLDLASQLSPSDKLQGILVPAPEHKRPSDYVAGLFRLDIGPRPRPVPRDPLPPSSVYFTTSESKAKFLTRYTEDMAGRADQLGDNEALEHKKAELMSRLTRKLEVLRDEQVVVAEESRVNEDLGGTVAVQVGLMARPHEAAKYRLHVEEVGKITSLLLGLSGRLARVDNALLGMTELHAERKMLESKRDKLQEQLEEAKKLKENIDRRSVIVSNILYKYFNSEEYADYDHFINMKAKLIMESREIIDKIKLGEEQLVALRETLSSPES